MKLVIDSRIETELMPKKGVSIKITPNKEVSFALLKLKFDTENKKDLEGFTFNLIIEYDVWGESRFRFRDVNHNVSFNDDLTFTKPLYQPELISSISVRFNIPPGANSEAIIATTFQIYEGFPEPTSFDATRDEELIKQIPSNDVLDYGNLIRQYDSEALLRYAKTYQNYTETNKIQVLKKNLFDYCILRQAVVLVGMGRLNSDSLINEFGPFIEGYSIVKEANEEYINNPRPDWQMLKINLLDDIDHIFRLFDQFNNIIAKHQTDKNKWESEILPLEQFWKISKTYVNRLVEVFRELAAKEAIFELIQINISDWHFENSSKNTEVLTINLRLIPGYEIATDMINSTIKFSISKNVFSDITEYYEQVIKHTSFPDKFNITDRAKQIVYSNRIASLPDWKNVGYEYRDGIIGRPEWEKNKLEEKAFFLIKQAILNCYAPSILRFGFKLITKESEKLNK